MTTPDRSDLVKYPTFAAPWTVSGNELRAVGGRYVRAAGAATTGYANLPSSWSQAQTWMRKYRKIGLRVGRPHHIDKMLLDNAAHKDRFQLYLNAGRYYGIPMMLEGMSEGFDKSKLAAGDFTGWTSYLDLLFSMDIGNVVAMCPVNEPLPTSPEVFAMQVKELRKRGFKGLVFGSNANIQGGEYGELEDSHNYTGHPEVKDGKLVYYDCSYPEWSNVLTYKTNLPRIVTECGMLKGPQQGGSDVRFYDDCQPKEVVINGAYAVRSCQVVIAHALCTSWEDWSSNTSEDRDYQAFINNPVRMRALDWLVQRMAGQVEPTYLYNTSPTYV